MATGDLGIGSSQPAQEPLVEPIPFTLLDEPLDYIFADHFRQRSILAALRRFAAAGKVNRSEADMVVAYLERDLPLHHDDEDEDLFPALRRRALPEDDLGAVLARLREDHRQAQPMVEMITASLSAHPARDIVRIDSSTREVMLAYAAGEHRHLAIENGIVLAIARIRLTRNDLKAVSRGMKLRRGVS
jgi:hemerythrin-like domain-containing protein